MRFLLAKKQVDTLVNAVEDISQPDSSTNAEASPSPSEEHRTLTPVSTAGLASDREQITLWLRRADQWLLGFLLIALLVLLAAFRWKLSGGGRTEIEIVSQQPREYFYTLDVNKASWVEWAQLDGIGEKLAKRIAKDREDRGPFESVDEVRRVRGLGPKLIEKLRPFLKCAGDRPRQNSDESEPVK